MTIYLFLLSGKPNIPEGIPKVTDITHNSITLSWLSPMNSGRMLAYQVEFNNLKDKKWRIVTSTCQGTTYHVKNLVPETQYTFRVRAENMCGQSKPSHISEEIRTRPVPTNYLEVDPVPAKKLVRRHSHYLKIDNGLSNLLSKTEEGDQVDSGNTVGSIPFRRNSMRGSVPASYRTNPRRNSVTSFLPGANAKRESMCSVKEARRSFEESSIPEEEGLNLKRISTSSTEASSLFSANSMTSIAEDEELQILYGQRDCLMCSDNDDTYSTTNSHVTTSSGFSSASSRSSHSSCTHSALIHQQPSTNIEPNANSSFLTASITDDSKLEYYSNTEKNYAKQTQNNSCVDKTRQNHPNAGKTIFDICDNEIWKGRIEHDTNKKVDTVTTQRNINVNNRNSLDLRSLRNMLNSQDIMVKTLDSCGYDSMRSRKHCVIKEMDEDITVDIVSSI